MKGLKEGQAVWVADPAIAKDALFNIGHVVSVDGAKATVETENNGKRQEIVVPTEECYHTNIGGHVPDHCQLVHLNPPTLLENTRARFEDDKIYTYVGDILVAINPFKWILGIYDESVMEQCKGKKLHNAACGPHVFAVAEKAYTFLVKMAAPQCVVVSGESGSGKTETNKQLMNYLVFRGSNKGHTSDLTQKILDTNPILEAFGNAKTTRNKNSSRFGRYVLVRFSEEHEVIGAQVRVFLLERSRVTAASNANERSYHAFYQLTSNEKYIQPARPDAHRYLSLSGCTTIDGVNDANDFQENNHALFSIGLSVEETDAMWSLVAAFLYLGSLNFGSGDQATISDDASVEQIELLLGVSSLKGLLIQRAIKVGSETTMADHNPAQARIACDALVKIMYARLFSYLVMRINSTVDSKEVSSRYIGLLDVYGFEFFAVNSFEQLCINFANEKLQQFFLQTVFENEGVAYKEEGIPWTPIPYADNKAIIDLCEAPTTGIYATLDTQCRTPNASGRTFCGALHKAHAKSLVFGAPKVSRKETRSKEDHFIVKHFAGDVVYLATEFLDKNNDSLAAEVEQALLKSTIPLVATVCTPETNASSNGKKKAKSSFASVGAKFVQSLRELMAGLTEAKAHFIRCIKPNPEAKPNKIHGVSVMEQLRMSGTLDAVRLIQAGYPTRIPYEDLYSRYRDMMPPNVRALPPPDFCEVIAAVCDIGKDQYALGMARMFFRLGTAAILEELQDADPEEMKPILLAKLELFEKKKKARPIVEKTVHMWIHKRRYKVMVAELRARQAEERRIAEEARRKEEEAQRRKAEEEARQREAEERRQAEERAKHEAERQEHAKIEAKAAAGNVSIGEVQQQEAKQAAACSKILQEADAMVHTLDDRHEDLHAAVEKIGGIEGVVKLSATNSMSADVQAHFVGLIRDLCVSDEIADEIAGAGGVERIMEAAHQHYDVPDVMIEVADAVRNLTATAEIALKVGASGGVKVLIDAAARHLENAEVARAVVGALWALSVHDELVPSLVKLGGVQAVIAAALNLPKDEDVQSSAAALVRNLAVNEDVRWSVAELGGIGILTGAIEYHPDSAEVAAQVACALWNLAQTPDVASEVAASGAVELLVNMAATFATEPTVQLGVCGCFRLVCINDAAADVVISAGGLPALMGAAGSHQKRADVQRAFVGALWELATHGFAAAVAEAHAVHAVLRAAERHPKEERLNARVAGVLRLLAVSDETKSQIGEEGGVGTLLKMAKVFPSSPTVQADVAGALAVLAVDDSLESTIADGGGIELLVGSLERHAGNQAVVAHVWHALTNLSVSVSNKARIVNMKSTTSHISSTLRTHANAPRVVEGVATTLRNLCLGGVTSGIVDAAIVDTLLQLLKLYTPQTIVALAVAGAIRALASDMRLAREMASKYNGHEILKGALAAHKDDDRLGKEVESALRRLDAALSGEGMENRASVSEGGNMKGEKTRLPLGTKHKQKEVGTLKDSVVSQLTPKGARSKR